MNKLELMNEIIIDIKGHPAHQRVRVYDRLKRANDSVDFSQVNEIIDGLIELGIFVECRSINGTEPEGYLFGLKINYKEEPQPTQFVQTTFEPEHKELYDLFEWDDSEETTQKMVEQTFPLPEDYTPYPHTEREELRLEVEILDRILVEIDEMESQLRGCIVVEDTVIDDPYSFSGDIDLDHAWFI